MGSNKNRTISKNMYFASKTHAAHYGPGQDAVHIPHTRKVTIKSETLDLCMQFLLNDNNVQELACDTNPLVLSTGEVLEVPSVARLDLHNHMWTAFVEKHTDINGVYSNRLP